MLAQLSIVHFLQFRSFLRRDRARNGANFETYTTVNASIEVDPIPGSAFNVSPWPWMNAGDRTGWHADRYAFADISCNCISHMVGLNG